MNLRVAKKVWDRQSMYRMPTRQRARRRVLRWLKSFFKTRHDFAVAA